MNFDINKYRKLEGNNFTSDDLNPKSNDFNKILNLRNSYTAEDLNTTNDLNTTKEITYISSNNDENSKDTFPIANSDNSNYNIENINIKKNSMNHKDKFNFDNLSNKENYFEIEYNNNLNINSDVNNFEGLSNNNLLSEFYELDIKDYPERYDLKGNSFQNDENNSKKDNFLSNIFKSISKK